MYTDGPLLNEKDFNIKMYTDERQFLVEGSYLNQLLSVNEEGEFHIGNLSKDKYIFCKQISSLNANKFSEKFLITQLFNFKN